MDDTATNFQVHHKPKAQPKQEEDDEDTLSLSDFPLNSDGLDKKDTTKIQDKRRSSSEPSEFFEFFNDFTSEMSHAEDIIFCGKLVPYKNHHQILKSLSVDDASDLSRRYPTRPNVSIKTRSNHSLDCKKLRRRQNISSEASENIHRSFSRSSAKSDQGSTKASKPRWFVLMFGPLKLQQEMDLRDMKNRQVRRNPGSIFPAMEAGGKVPAGRRSTWGHDLLRVLSCNSHASVAVTASIGLVPHF